MMQRICPVCDQVMKHAHYCSACHSWVKDPVYMNVTYYLNERHPKNEAHCSYHNGEQEAAKAGIGKQRAMPWELGNTGKHARKNVTPNQLGRNAAAGPKASDSRNRRAQTDQAQWQTRAGITPYTSTFVFAECCVFNKQLQPAGIFDRFNLRPQGTTIYAGAPSPEVTVLFCLVPSPEFSQAPEYSLPDHLCRFSVRFR